MTQSEYNAAIAEINALAQDRGLEMYQAEMHGLENDKATTTVYLFRPKEVKHE